MGKQIADPTPTRVEIGKTSAEIAGKVRILDAKTREVIAKVLMADSAAGKVRRFAVSAEGNLIRENNRLKIVEEDRPCVIEWITSPGTPAVDSQSVGEDKA
jgi:hypothetical protein